MPGRYVHAGLAGVGQAGLHFHQITDHDGALKADAAHRDDHAITFGPAGRAGVAGFVDLLHPGATMDFAAKVDSARLGQEAQGDRWHMVFQ